MFVISFKVDLNCANVFDIIGSSPKVIGIPNALDPFRPSTIKKSKEYDLNDDPPQVESSNHDSSSEQNENDEEVEEKEEQEKQEGQGQEQEEKEETIQRKLKRSVPVFLVKGFKFFFKKRHESPYKALQDELLAYC